MMMCKSQNNDVVQKLWNIWRYMDWEGRKWSWRTDFRKREHLIAVLGLPLEGFLHPWYPTTDANISNKKKNLLTISSEYCHSSRIQRLHSYFMHHRISFFQDQVSDVTLRYLHRQAACQASAFNLPLFLQGSQFASFRGGTFTPFLLCCWGYYSVFRAASLSQTVREDSKSDFECSVWILTVKCNAHNFSQYYNFQNQKVTMLENVGYITGLTAWRCFQGHSSGTHLWRGGNCSHFFRLTHSTKF